MGARIILSVAAAWSTGACGVSPAQKTNDPKTILACMEAQRAHDDYTRVTKCEPLGNEQTFGGIWYVGFEISGFRSGDTEDLNKPVQIAELESLVVPSSLDLAAHRTDSKGPNAYVVQFKGRRSLVEAGDQKSIIVLDKIISLRKLASEPRVATQSAQTSECQLPNSQNC